MTAVELFTKLLALPFATDRMPVVYIDEDSGATVEIEGVLVEDGQVKLISGFTQTEAEIK